MIPIRDENPAMRQPVITFVLIAANVAVWVGLQGVGFAPMLAQSICSFGLVPGELLGVSEVGHVTPLSAQVGCVMEGHASPITAVTSMFMHGGWLHIIFNMWFLWIFGDNVEDVMGRARFALFYLVCGLAAAAAQIVSNPDSMVPMVGASGAIGGVMGAYARIYPRARVHMLIFFGFFITTVSVPALFMLGYWFLLQLVSGLPALGDEGGGVAFWAHAGGFVAGIALSYVFVNGDLLRAHRALPVKRQADARWF